jgi:predicted RNase H-like nuclease (RuvC/YqgF family)
MTAAERQALKDAKTPEAILKKLQDGGNKIQVTTMAFKKVAAQERARAEMFEESLRAELAEAAYARQLDLGKEVSVLKQEISAIERENKQLHAKLNRATASRAMVESGEGTSR